MNIRFERTKTIIIALFAGMIGVLAQLTIPLPVVPITGQTLAIGLAATILGSKYGTYAVILYVLWEPLAYRFMPICLRAYPFSWDQPADSSLVLYRPLISPAILEKTSFRIGTASLRIRRYDCHINLWHGLAQICDGRLLARRFQYGICTFYRRWFNQSLLGIVHRYSCPKTARSR